jgi:hypothetical protein
MKDELSDAILESRTHVFWLSHKETTIEKDHDAGRAGQPLFPDPIAAHPAGTTSD